MKPLNAFFFVALVAAVGGGGWWFGRSSHANSHAAHPSAAATNGERRALYYQSAMHPWIKLDKPGKCTICGMALTAVFEGDHGIAAGEGIVSLGTNTIQAIHVATEIVQEAPLRRTLRFAGTIEDDDSRHRFLSAYVAGRIDRLFVNYQGAEVKEGEPLALLYSPMLLTAQREYLALKKQADLGESTRSLLAAAGQRLRQLGLNDTQIGALNDVVLTNIHTEVLAPMTGTVVKRLAYEGEYVMEGQKLFELADFSTMWFQFDAYEQDLPWLALGQEVVVTTPSVTGKTFAGKIAFIDPNVRDLSRSARVRVEIPNPLVTANGREQRLLRHRLFAEATVQLAAASALLVPRTAVLMPDHRPLVYVDKGGGAYEQREVKLGRRGDSSWEVLEGLTAGEAVVTQGNLLIDAQAQLNSGGSPDNAAPEASTNSAGLLTAMAFGEPQQALLSELFAGADKLGVALAADDLSAFNAATQPLHALVPKVAAVLNDLKGWSTIASQLNQSGHLAEAKNLAEARKAFHGFVTPVTELALGIRRNTTNAVPRIFQCPMTKRSFVGAPANARWIQLTTETRNPYYGAAMLDCGAEVKP